MVISEQGSSQLAYHPCLTKIDRPLNSFAMLRISLGLLSPKNQRAQSLHKTKILSSHFISPFHTSSFYLKLVVLLSHPPGCWTRVCITTPGSYMLLSRMFLTIVKIYIMAKKFCHFNTLVNFENVFLGLILNRLPVCASK